MFICTNQKWEGTAPPGDEDVIDVVEGEIQDLEDSIHESLERLGCILQVKWHA